MKYPRATLILLSAAAMAVALTGCTAATGGQTGTPTSSGASAEEEVTVGYVCLSPLHVGFGNVMINGAEDAAKANNVKLVMANLDTSPFDAATLTQNVQSVINQEPDALVACNFFGDATAPAIAKATEQGIPVVLTNATTGAEEIQPIATFGQADFEAGVAAGEAMADSGVTNGVCVNDNPTAPNVIARCEGMVQALEDAGVAGTILNIPNAAGNAVAIANATKGALASDPSIDGALAQGPLAGPVVYDAVEQSGKQDTVKVATMDVSDQVLSYIEDDKLLFAVWQQPYLQGYYAVLAAAQYVRYGAQPSGQVFTGPIIVNKDNAAKIMDAAKNGRG